MLGEEIVVEFFHFEELNLDRIDMMINYHVITGNGPETNYTYLYLYKIFKFSLKIEFGCDHYELRIQIVLVRYH